MDILFVSHSHTRWLVFIAAAIVLIKFAYGWYSGSTYTKTDRIISSSFVGLMDLQGLIGIVLFALMWSELGFDRLRMEHAFTNLIAVVLAHLPARWKNDSDTMRFRKSFIVYFSSILLILVGIARLSGGMNRLIPGL